MKLPPDGAERSKNAKPVKALPSTTIEEEAHTPLIPKKTELLFAAAEAFDSNRLSRIYKHDCCTRLEMISTPFLDESPRCFPTTLEIVMLLPMTKLDVSSERRLFTWLPWTVRQLVSCNELFDVFVDVTWKIDCPDAGAVPLLSNNELESEIEDDAKMIDETMRT